MVVSCQRCGAESPDDFRFCPACGAPLAPGAAPRQARKIVTVLFCDVTGSTTLGEELDPQPEGSQADDVDATDLVQLQLEHA